MKVSWNILKSFISDRSLSAQLIDLDDSYYIKAIDGNFSLYCVLNKSPSDSTDLDDFEANYKASGNQSPKSSVQTQFERSDLILKICSAAADVQSDSTATITIKVPGVLADGNVMFISGGDAWFNEQHKDDRICKISIIDKDNVLGYGADTVLKTYHDELVDEPNQGWRIPIKFGHIYAETLGFYGEVPASLYVVIEGKKGGSITTGTMYLNLEWGRSW